MLRVGRSILALAVVAAACGKGQPALVSPQLLTGTRSLAYEQDATLFQVTNGMMVALLPDANTNLVKIDVRYKVGSAADPAGKAGLAHVVEHMTFSLRPDGPDAASIGARLASASLYYNAYTSTDETHYTAIADQAAVGELVALEAARTAGTCDQLDEGTFARERAVVRSELAQRETPGALAYAALLEGLYGEDHQYGHPVIGSDASIAGMTLADVCAFMAEHYQPNRVIMVVSGNIRPDVLQQTIGKAFGPIPSTTEMITRVPPPTARVEITRRLPVEQATAFVAFPVPADQSASATTERLLRGIVAVYVSEVASENDYVTRAYVAAAGSPRSPYAVVAVSVDDEERLADAVEATYAKLGEAAKWVVDGAGAGDGTSFDITFRHIINAERARLIAGVEPLLRRGDVFADYLQYSGHHYFVIKDLDRLQNIGPSAMVEAAQTYYQRKDARTVFVVPGDGEATTERADIEFSGDDFDLSDWTSPVDPAEADRPLAVEGDAWVPDIHEVKLGNGMRALLVPNMTMPLVDVRLVFPSGSLDEPAGAAGLAELAAELLQHDYSRKYRIDDKNAIEFIETMGGSIETDVGLRSTTFRIVGLSSFADGFIWKLHWLMHNGIYSGKKLAAMKKLAADVDDDESRTSRRRERAVYEAVYGADHPFARSTDVFDGIAGITTAGLRAFKARHYRPRGATLVITGKFDVDQVERQVRRLWGDMSPGPHPTPVDVPAAAPRAKTAYLAVAEDDPQVTVQVRIPLAGGYDQVAVRFVVSEVLEQRMRALRERLGATYGVHVALRSRAGAGELIVRGSFTRNKAAEAYAALMAVLAGFDDEALAADFVRARRKVLQVVLARTADSAGVASELEVISRLGVGRDYYARLARGVAALTVSRARAAMAEDIALSRAVVVATGDRATVEAMFQAAGVSGVRWLD